MHTQPVPVPFRNLEFWCPDAGNSCWPFLETQVLCAQAWRRPGDNLCKGAVAVTVPHGPKHSAVPLSGSD